MQFICESCKAHLLVADDKIRGKRLIVRCKRCGVQIRIVDPALASQSTAGPPTGPLRGASAPAPLSPSSQAGARPPSGPIRGGSIARASAPRRETDIESTRAMDSEVLEKAVRASKEGEPAPGPRIAPPPPPPREPPPPRDPAVWFAMIQGQQIGPMSRAELGTEASAGQVGPRTYLWKEGMEAWIRAMDVPELVPLFAAPPTPPPPPREESPAAQQAREQPVALPFESAPVAPGSSASPRIPAGGRAVEQSTSPDAPTPPGGMQLPEESAGAAGQAQPVAGQPGAGEAASAPGALDLARWGAEELSKPRAETPEALPRAAPSPPAAREFRVGQP